MSELLCKRWIGIAELYLAKTLVDRGALRQKVIFLNGEGHDQEGILGLDISPETARILVQGRESDPVEFSFVKSGSTKIERLNLARADLRSYRWRLHIEERPAKFYPTR